MGTELRCTIPLGWCTGDSPSAQTLKIRARSGTHNVIERLRVIPIRPNQNPTGPDLSEEVVHIMDKAEVRTFFTLRRNGDRVQLQQPFDLQQPTDAGRTLLTVHRAPGNQMMVTMGQEDSERCVTDITDSHFVVEMEQNGRLAIRREGRALGSVQQTARGALELRGRGRGADPGLLLGVTLAAVWLAPELHNPGLPTGMSCAGLPRLLTPPLSL